MKIDYLAPWRVNSPDNLKQCVAGVAGVTNLKKPNATKGLSGQETATPNPA